MVSLLLACSFLVLAVSGVWMFFSAYSKGLEIIHYTFGFLFSIVAVFHLVNNSRALVQYLKKPRRQ
ncbi:DUF4405 domain-containing protein [Aquiflexum lacus]|uniref:DUF4405 domain-containing protein n=1 Tax=Aquiflexum lacus TaxID=2483805 RepID=UPI0018933F67